MGFNSSSKILPVSNARLKEIMPGFGIGVDYDSEFSSEEELEAIFEGDADAYIRVKNRRVYTVDAVTNIKEITILIPRIVVVYPGCILTIEHEGEDKTYKVNDFEETVNDIGLPEAIRCYVNEVF